VLYYEDLPQGFVLAVEASYLITEDEIREVAERWGTPFDAADPVAPPLLMVAMMSAIEGRRPTQDRVAAVSALGFERLDLHVPVRPGDRITSWGEVMERRLSQSRPGIGVLSMEGGLRNQRDEVVFSSVSALLVQCRPASDT